jgi:hypothetical protein
MCQKVKNIEDLCPTCLAEYEEFLVKQQEEFDQGRHEMAEAARLEVPVYRKAE